MTLVTFAGICQSKIDIFITKFVLPLFKGGGGGIVSPNFGFILGAFKGVTWVYFVLIVAYVRVC